MNNFIARANIDHFLELLKDDDLSVEKRSVICKLLIEEENKLSRDLEQLEFAQSRAAQCQQRVDQLHDLRNGFTDGSTGRMRAENLLATFQELVREADAFCDQLREIVKTGPL